MSTSQQRDDAKERFWRHVVRQWRRSGVSVREFCAEHDLTEASFYHWRRTLGQRDAEGVAFVPVQVRPEPEGSSASNAALELVLDAGRVLRVGPGFDAATLRRLLALLEEGQPC